MGLSPLSAHLFVVNSWPQVQGEARVVENANTRADVRIILEAKDRIAFLINVISKMNRSIVCYNVRRYQQISADCTWESWTTGKSAGPAGKCAIISAPFLRPAFVNRAVLIVGRLFPVFPVSRHAKRPPACLKRVQYQKSGTSFDLQR